MAQQTTTPQFLDPNVQAETSIWAAGSNSPNAPDLALEWYSAGTQPIAGYSGGPNYQTLSSALTQPSQAYRTINVPGMRLGAGGAATPQNFTYNLPYLQSPNALESRDTSGRRTAIQHSRFRGSFRLAIPGATEGEYREYDTITDPDSGEISYQKREGWKPTTDEMMTKWFSQYSANTQRKSSGPAEAKYLAEQSEASDKYAKWYNEQRYSQLQDFMAQHWQNQMETLSGVGESQRQDILRQGKQMRESSLSNAMSRGMAGTTALAAMQRGVQHQTDQDMSRFYEQMAQQRLGVQDRLASQYMGLIEGRTDEYPNAESLSNLIYQSAASGMSDSTPKARTPCPCAIFLEGRHGDGTMDWVVRKYRDEVMSVKNARGYYKMAEVLVPFMRRSKLFKLIVMLLLIEPLFSYGRWYYRKEIRSRNEKVGIRGRLGWIFAPVKTAWLKAWEFLGGDHPFIRWNGETI